jgi:hypothetical protein
VFSPLRGKTVLIWSGEHNAYWGPERRGYYDKPQAGRYTFLNAHLSTRHCGPEKRIAYELAPPEITKLELSIQASWVPRRAAGWAGELLTNSETVNEPATNDVVRRFCEDIREQLAVIEGWGE